MNGAVKQITEAEVREVARRLQIAYLVDKSGQIEDPVDALVRTILSQNTSDRNRDVAMARLREYFPDWDAVADAPLPELIDTIRATNYAPTKAQRIQEILRHLRAERGRITLDFLRSWPVEEVERYLLSFKGIGKKTAACVLAFALGRPAFPVDTHVRRVGIRLGWLDEKMSDERAHERMQALCPPELTLPLHFGMWAHGHFTCRPRPRCARCPIYEFCLYPEKTSPAGIPPERLAEVSPIAAWTPTYEEQRALPFSKQPSAFPSGGGGVSGIMALRMMQTIPITNLETQYPRRKTRPVRVGRLTIGGGAPIVVQSMITENTRDVDAAVRQIIQLCEAGCELVRVTAPSMRDAYAIAEIRAALQRRGLEIPLAADVHHEGTQIAVETAKHVDKVRLNPGLFVFRKLKPGTEYTAAEFQAAREQIERELIPVLQACREYGTALRIGVNHGSLSDRMTVTYGDTPEGMVQSALEFIKICEQQEFRDIVISLKASRVPVMIQANRLLVRRMDEQGMDYPLHLGVTEAGDGQYARVKSTLGIGTLLAEGIGDTIRVSLAEDPVNEIPVCYEILQGLGLRRTQAEFIACPGCGRTKFDLPTVLNQVKAATAHLKGLNIAVMGCIVNGPGEMADADYGYVGKGEGLISLYRGREIVKNMVPAERGVEELINLLKADGVWEEPAGTEV